MQSKRDPSQLEKHAQMCKGGRTFDPEFFQSSWNCYKRQESLPSWNLDLRTAKSSCSEGLKCAEEKIYRDTFSHKALKPFWRHSCLCQIAAGAGRMLLPFYCGNGSAAPPAAEWFTLQITNAIMCCNENVLHTVTSQRAFKD